MYFVSNFYTRSCQAFCCPMQKKVSNKVKFRPVIPFVHTPCELYTSTFKYFLLDQSILSTQKSNNRKENYNLFGENLLV